MIKAVIFDMFETLITHYEAPLYFGKQIAQDMGIAESQFRKIWDASERARTLGNKTLEEVIEEILKDNNCYTQEVFDKVILKRRHAKVECFAHLHPEILPMLQGLKERNVKIALISNCYTEERDVIRESILYPYFDVACMSCELQMYKPQHEIYHACLAALGVKPQECLYVGDGGSQELEAAQAVGLHPVQATWYLKEGVNQPSGIKAEFAQANTPLEILNNL